MLQYEGFAGEPRAARIRYKLAQSPSALPTDAQRKFVRLVVDTTAMTFEGHPTSWEGVGALLANVPNRKNTVLESAVTSDQITVAQQNEWFQKAITLAQEHGFAYGSFIGIHAPGADSNQRRLWPLMYRVEQPAAKP